jgi:hypothetical protein
MLNTAAKRGEEESINTHMRIAELQPDHPSAIKARHDKWRMVFFAFMSLHGHEESFP